MIEIVSDWFQHEFIMVWVGILVWFVLKYSFMVSDKDEAKIHNFRDFWKDQKDEFISVVVLSLTFIVYDDETVKLYAYYIKQLPKEEVKEMSAHLPRPYYLLIGIAIDQVYYGLKKVYQLRKKLIK